MLNCIFGSLFFSWSLTVSCRNNIIFDASLCKCLFLGHKLSQAWAKPLLLLLHVCGKGQRGGRHTARSKLSGLQREEGGERRLGLSAAWVSKLRLLHMLIKSVPGQWHTGNTKRPHLNCTGNMKSISTHSQTFKDFQPNLAFLQPETPLSCGVMRIQPG